MSGNYVGMGNRSGPDSQHELPSQVQTSGVIIGGTGSPEGVVPGMPGQVYEDNSVSPGILWIKIAGTGASGWRQVGIVAGVGTVGQQVFFGAASNPNGIQTAVGPSVYFGANGSIWVMPTGTSGNTGWQQVVGGV